MANFGSGPSTYPGGVAPPLRPAAASLDPRAIGAEWRRYTYDDFRMVTAKAAAGGAASGATDAINVLDTGNVFGTFYEYAIVGAGQTIIVPVLTTTGLNIGLDQTLDEGLELIFGAQHAGVARGKHAYTVGSTSVVGSRTFFAKWKLSIEDVSGAELYVGWKKAVAYNTAISSYTDYATLSLTAGLTAVNSVTRLNNGAPVTTATGKTWADNESHTIAVVVNGVGQVSYYWDGAKLRTPPAFTLDASDVVVPWLRFMHLTDVAGAVRLQQFESGYVGLAPTGAESGA